MNKEQYIFVFSNTPDGPSVIQGIFSIEKAEDAQKFNDEAHGYRDMMIGEWKGSGPLPERSKMKKYSPKENICVRCNGNGFEPSPKPANKRKCKKCKGTGESDEIL